MPTPINPKVANGLGASGASGPLVVLIIYYLNKYAGPLPPEIAAAYAAIIVAAAGFLGGFLTRLEARGEAPAPVSSAPSTTQLPPATVTPPNR